MKNEQNKSVSLETTSLLVLKFMETFSQGTLYVGH